MNRCYGRTPVAGLRADLGVEQSLTGRKAIYRLQSNGFALTAPSGPSDLQTAIPAGTRSARYRHCPPTFCGGGGAGGGGGLPGHCQ